MARRPKSTVMVSALVPGLDGKPLAVVLEGRAPRDDFVEFWTITSQDSGEYLGSVWQHQLDFATFSYAGARHLDPRSWAYVVNLGSAFSPEAWVEIAKVIDPQVVYHVATPEVRRLSEVSEAYGRMVTLSHGHLPAEAPAESPADALEQRVPHSTTTPEQGSRRWSRPSFVEAVAVLADLGVSYPEIQMVFELLEPRGRHPRDLDALAAALETARAVLA